MSESKLVQYRNLTKNYSRRTESIGKIAIHHAAAVASAKKIVDGFIPAQRKASATYVIGNDGDYGQSVLESNRPWTDRSTWCDNKAVTIEVSNCATGGEWPISDAAYKSLIRLCVDICQRNGIKSVNYTGTKNGVLVEHRMFAATLCPGPYIHNLLVSGKIAQDINAGLREGASIDGYMYEGIDLSPVFNAQYYGSRYADLVAAGLTTPQQLWAHFTTFGMGEARQASAQFDPVKYRNVNPDLNAAFGDDWEAYYKHYCLCGKAEIEAGQRKGM